MAKRSEPRVYPYPPRQVYEAALANLPAQKLTIAGADPNRLTIWADKSVSALSWGEKVTVYVYQADQGQTAVVVDSALKFGLFSWGAHTKNFRRVYDAIEQGLGLQGRSYQQAPGPYPYQQQQPQAQPPGPPPGATQF